MYALRMCINHQFGGSTSSFVDAFPGDLVGEGVVPSVLLTLVVGCQQVQPLLRVELRVLQVLRWNGKQY